VTVSDAATVTPATASTAVEMDIAPGESMWKRAEQLPCLLSVELKVPVFTVRDLFRLSAGSVIETDWAQSTDVPLFVNKELIGWGEFEVLGEGLAVRVTEFA
jgi:flagellar motor switch/type III secretory pathway protein FliN